jgi:amidohydrolase
MLKISPEVKKLIPELTRIRRWLHQHPEPGMQEIKTSGFIASRLKGWGIETKTGVAKTGVVGLVRGANRLRTILVRADMDGLPIQEQNRVPYRSRHPGFMHACGHDAHIAIGLISCRILHQGRGRLGGVAKFVFQPAEEGPGGAIPMIREGVLQDPKVDAALALHMWSELPLGKVGIRSGPVFANADEFEITIVGRGGHGASPHRTIDPVVVSAHVILGLQNIVSRKVDTTKPAVVTVGKISGGRRHNIIPDEVTLHGTIRTIHPEVRTQVRRVLEGILKGITSGFGASYRLVYKQVYPLTLNAPDICALVREVAREVVGKRNVVEQGLDMGAEDMSYILQRVPGCYFVLGSSAPGRGLKAPQHSPHFDIDERVLPIGVEIIVKSVQRFLGA